MEDQVEEVVHVAEDKHELESLQETGRLGRLGRLWETIPILDTTIDCSIRYTTCIYSVCYYTMATSDTFEKIYELLKVCPGLSGVIGIENTMSFIRLATCLKEEILFKQPPGHDPSEPPDKLPQNMKDFIGSAAKILDAYV